MRRTVQPTPASHCARRLVAAGLLLTVAACGGGGDGGSPTDPNPPGPPVGPSFPNPGAGEVGVAVTVGIPAGFFATPSQLSLFAGTQPVELAADGTGRTNLPTNVAGVVGVADRASNTPVLLALRTGGGTTQAVNTRTTAEALGFLVPALATSDPARASQIMNVLRTAPAVTQLQTAIESRLASSPQQALVSGDPAVMNALRTAVSQVLQTVPSPRFEQPLRTLPAQETPTDRGGITMNVLPDRDAQGRLQVTLDNGRPRWVAVVRSYSNDGVTWNTPAAENGPYGVMLGPGVQGRTGGQPHAATIPLSPSPYIRIKTFALGSDLAQAEADPDFPYLLGAVAAQGLADVAIPAVEPVLQTTQLRNTLTWGSGQTGLLQQWAASLIPCFNDPAIRAAIEAGVQAGNLDEAFRAGLPCLMRVAAQNPAILSGLLQAAGQNAASAPASLRRMFDVLGQLGTGVEGVFNTEAIRATRAMNVFELTDPTRLVAIDSVRPSFADKAGGATVRLFGTALDQVTAVTVNGVAATPVTPVSATALDVRVPAIAEIGLGTVVASTADGRSARCEGCLVLFTPTIGIAPSEGPLAGGTQVTVTDLAAPTALTAVRIDGRDATALTPLSATSVRFTTPAGTSLGAKDVVFVYGDRGGLGCPGCFTYVDAAQPQGRFSGVVVNAVNGQPIAGANVSIRRPDNTPVDAVTTGANGAWTSNPLPAGTYDLHFSATGFLNSPLFGRLLAGGTGVPVTPLPTVELVPSGSGSGTISGVVRDATNNAVIAGATVELRAGAYNTTGTVIATTTTAANGSYAFAAQPSGTYSVRATKTGFSEGLVNVTVPGANATAPVLFMSPTGTNVVWRFVLSWGANPGDLDSHLTGPVPGSANRFHVYFSTKGSLTASPFARLDVDVTSGFGPETITIAQQFPGTYRYYVYKFSGTGEIRTSNARVDVYQGNTLVRQFYPPQQDGRYWTVFEIDGTTLTPVNTIGTTQPQLVAPTGPMLRADTPAARAAAEWLTLAPWHWHKTGAP